MTKWEKGKQIFETKTDRGFIFKAWELQNSTDALIEVERDGKIIRSFTFPAYKVWNIPAHAHDIIEMIDKEILMEFCKNAGNENFRSPYSIGDYTYATNGNIFIKVPRMAEFSENPQAPDPEKVDYGEVKAWYLVKIETPQTVRCPECLGAGIVYFETDYNEYEINCKSCDGTGRMMPKKSMNFHGVLFDQKYLFLLSKLPNCEIGITGPSEISPFRFDGGTGAIMPMRHKE